MENNIIIPYQYAYFWGSLYLLAIWLFFYWRIPEIRKLLLFFSLSIVWLGLLAEYFWFLRDWWHPLTITRTKLGIEDFIASITHLTIPALLYKYFFSKKVPRIKLGIGEIKAFSLRISAIFLAMAAAIFILHYYFKIHTAHTFIVCFLAANILVILRRPDLFIPALWSGILFDLIFFILYTLGNIFSPGVFEALWDKSVLTGMRFFNVPVVDYLFYFLWGSFGGIIYEYIFQLRIENSNGPGLFKDLKKIKAAILSNY
jgi:hypothetical protein